MPPTELTNDGLFKWLSKELVGLTVIPVGLGLIAWGTLTAQVEAQAIELTSHATRHANDIAALNIQIDGVEDDVGDIKSDIGVIKNNQLHYTQALAETKASQVEMLGILRELQILSGSR